MAAQGIIIARGGARQREGQIVQRPHLHGGEIQHRQRAIVVEIGGAVGADIGAGDADGFVMEMSPGAKFDRDMAAGACPAGLPRCMMGIGERGVVRSR